MCVGLTPRLCECGCSEHDHDEPSFEDRAFHVHFGGAEPSRGKCNGQRLDYQDLLSEPDKKPVFKQCACQRFKDMFEPEYTCRMP